MTNVIDLIGKTYGRLTVVSYAGRGFNKSNSEYWYCDCSCGTKNHRVQAGNLKQGAVKSCGCIVREQKTTLKHGEASHGYNGKQQTKEYKAWSHMKGRCYCTGDGKYRAYGARGIQVCDRWLDSYENFLSDMGRAPSQNHSLDRIDVNGDYTPENCRWATWKEQQRNKQRTTWVTYNGERKALPVWCDELGLRYELVRQRIYSGWGVERAFFEPAFIGKNQTHKHN